MIKNRKVINTAVIIVLMVVAVLGSSCGKKNKNEVDVFCYGDYVNPKLIKQFEKETGIKVVLDTFDTNEELYPVIKNRAGVYDVVCLSDYMAGRMINEGLLQKLDKKKMPNLRHIGETYWKTSSKSFDPGNRYAVPYQWGYAGIMYNKKNVPEGIKSWDDLWNKKYKGRIIMQDSIRDTLGAALIKNGYSLNSKTKKELHRATDSLIEQKPLVYKYANDSARDLLIGGSADIGVVWNGEYLYSKKLNKDLEFVLPEEGTEIFIDNWCIPNNAFHLSNAEKWIDFMSRPDVAYENFKYLTFSIPNEGGRNLMPSDLGRNKVLFPADSDIMKCQLLEDLGPDTDLIYSEQWKRFKASN